MEYYGIDVGGIYIYKYSSCHIFPSWLPSFPSCLRNISQASIKAERHLKITRMFHTESILIHPLLSGPSLPTSILFWTCYRGMFLKIRSRGQLRQNHLTLLLNMFIPGPYPRPTELDLLKIDSGIFSLRSTSWVSAEVQWNKNPVFKVENQQNTVNQL